MAGELSQAGEPGQDSDAHLGIGIFGAALGKFVQCGESSGVIFLAFGFGELRESYHFGAFWEFGEDFLFGTSEDERSHDASEGQESIFGAVAFDGFGEVLSEFLPGAQESWADGPHEAPEFPEVVFQGGTGESKVPIGFDLPDCLCGFGVKVFDELGFVEHEGIPGSFGEAIDIALEELVAGDDQVTGPGRVDEGLSVVFSVEHGAERRSEFFGFALPVRADARRGDDQSGAVFGAIQEDTEGLDRFPQTHIVGKDAADTPVGEFGEPFVAGDLVFAEIGAKVFGDFGFKFPGSCETSEGIFPGHISIDGDIATEGFFDHCGACFGDAEFVSVADRDVLDGPEALAEGIGDLGELSVPERNEASALAQSREEFGQGDFQPVKFGEAIEPEPIATAAEFDLESLRGDFADDLHGLAFGPADRWGFFTEVLDPLEQIERVVWCGS